MTNKELRKLLKKHPSYTVNVNGSGVNIDTKCKLFVMLYKSQNVDTTVQADYLRSVLSHWGKHVCVTVNALNFTCKVCKRNKTITIIPLK